MPGRAHTQSQRHAASARASAFARACARVCARIKAVRSRVKLRKRTRARGLRMRVARPFGGELCRQRSRAKGSKRFTEAVARRTLAVEMDAGTYRRQVHEQSARGLL
eukprot:5183128-Pleurochrysis_carterae.AAC.1